MTSVNYGPNGEYSDDVSDEELQTAGDIMDALVPPSVLHQQIFRASFKEDHFTYVNAATEMGRIVLDLLRDNPERAVVNSSRPQMGMQIERDDWGHGRWWHYGNIADCISSWKPLDAYLVVVVTNDEIKAMIRAAYKEHGADADEYAKRYDDMQMNGWDYMARNHYPNSLPYVKEESGD